MTTDNTFDLAKSFYDIENARKRLELLTKANINHRSKRLLEGYVKRLAWIINDMLTSLPRESADIFRKQVCTWETLSFEAVFDELIMMSEQQREGFERFAKAYRKGEIELIAEDNISEAA